jgi:HAD superfamily hydrolase (TIGR01509 family)
MIRGVIFDFGQVICRFDLRLFLDRLLPFTNHTLPELQAAMHASVDLGIAYESGRLTSDEFFIAVRSRYGLTIAREDFVRAYTGIFTPIPETYDLIRSLKTRCRLGLLSNTNEWHYHNVIERTAVFPLFDAVTLSYRVGAMKPARIMYDDMLGKLGLPPQEIAYIDDVQVNVDAAAALGMPALCYTDHATLLADLHKLGVVWQLSIRGSVS